MINIKAAVIFTCQKSLDAGSYYIPYDVKIGTYNEIDETFKARETGKEYKKVSPDLEFGYSLLIDVDALATRYGGISLQENLMSFYNEASAYLYFSSNELKRTNQALGHFFGLNSITGDVKAMNSIDSPTLVSIDPSLCFDGTAVLKLAEGSLESENKVKASDKIKESGQDILLRCAEGTRKMKEIVKGQNPFINHLFGAVRNNKQVALLPPGFASNIEHIFMCGSTGTGKSLIGKVLPDVLGEKAYVRTSANDYTLNGYVGEDVINIIKNVYLAADKDLALAQTGIVFLDEFDKLVEIRDEVISKTQNVLLTMMSGEVKPFTTGGHHGEQVHFDTRHLTFIIAGSFEAIYNSKRQKKVGFGVENDGSINDYELTDEELIDFGVRSEILGRCGQVHTLNQLNDDNLIDILTNNPYNPLLAKKAIMALSNINLVYKDDLIVYIAKKANSRRYGARDLQKIIERTLKAINDILTTDPSALIGKEIEITPETVRDPQKYLMR